MEKKRYIAIAGNIGAGKSSLTSLLGKSFGWETYYESVEGNPYLSDFYDDMRRWSFNLQIYFLTSRFKNQKVLMKRDQSIIQDRTIYEDRSEEHTSELQSRGHLVCRLLLEKKTNQRTATRGTG